jgi:hypothetical protein
MTRHEVWLWNAMTQRHDLQGLTVFRLLARYAPRGERETP